MNQKGFANIVLVVIIIILAGAAGYFAVIRKYCEQIAPPKMGSRDQRVVEKDGRIYLCRTFFEKLSSRQTSPGITATDDGITDWQIYRNEAYGFEVRYPGEFPIRTKSTGGAVLFHLEVNAAPPPVADMGGPAKYLWIDVQNKQPLAGCLQEGTSSSSTTISGISATKCLIPGSFFGEGLGLWIQVNRGEYSYYFISDFYDRNKEVIDQIFSTFRFIK